MGVTGHTRNKPRQIAPVCGIVTRGQHGSGACKIVTQRQRIGVEHLFRRDGAGQIGQQRPKGGTEFGKTFQWFIQKPIRARRQRQGPPCRITRTAKDYRCAGGPHHKITDQCLSPAIGQAQINDNDIGAIKPQVRPCRTQGFSPS